MANVENSSPSIWSCAKVITLGGVLAACATFVHKNKEEVIKVANDAFKTIQDQYDKLFEQGSVVYETVSTSAIEHRDEILLVLLATAGSCLFVFRDKHPKAALAIMGSATAGAVALATLSDQGKISLTMPTLEQISAQVTSLKDSSTLKAMSERVVEFFTSKAQEASRVEAAKYAGGAAAASVALYGLYKIAKWINSPSKFDVEFTKAVKGDAEALKKITNLKYIKAQPFHNQAKIFEFLKEKGIMNNTVGCMLYYGFGTPVDVALSNDYFFKAVRSGSVDALFNLGVSYEKGEEVIKDRKTAFAFYKSGAEKGSYLAMSRLVNCYETGFGVEANAQEADRWRQQIVQQATAAAA